MTILSEIIKQKEKEVIHLKRNGLPEKYGKTNKNRDTPSIQETFSNPNHLNIIAEIKRASPSKGAINLNIDPVEQAKRYERLGADAISILTDQTFFKGSIEDLYNIRQAVELPILCKDFIIDKIQIDQAKMAGATIILLIVAALSPSKLSELYNYATNLGLDVLCEVHDEREMKLAVERNFPIIGINNRDLKTFQVDLHTTEKLTPMINNPSTIVIGESGIKTYQDAKRLFHAHVDGILVGETLMQATNLQSTFQQLKIKKNEG